MGKLKATAPATVYSDKGETYHCNLGLWEGSPEEELLVRRPALYKKGLFFRRDRMILQAA